jgi:hypothetical protein
MCARQSWYLTNGCGGGELNPSPVRKTVSVSRCVRASQRRKTHRYRVLRVTSRGVVRSVDREDAGRNASEGVEPRQTGSFVVADQVCSREGSTVSFAQMPTKHAYEHEALMSMNGTTGVQVHGMYLQSISEPGRSPRHAERARARNTYEQGVTSKFALVGGGEVRCHRSSWEVG